MTLYWFCTENRRIYKTSPDGFFRLISGGTKSGIRWKRKGTDPKLVESVVPLNIDEHLHLIESTRAAFLIKELI
jgi:hypothetical protein